MPLTGQQTVSLYRCLGKFRTDWDDAGLHAAVEKLARDPRPAVDLLAQAVGQAVDSGNRTPERLLHSLPVAPAPAPSVIREARVIYEPCKECGYAGPPRVDNGECVGCWQNKQATTVRRVSPAPVPRRSGPPPAGLTYKELRAAKAKETAK